MSKEQILSNSKLIEEAVANDEGKLVSNGAFLALTGSRTGRSPKDRFIVEEASTRDQIEWGNINQPFNSDDFNNLWDKVSDYLSKDMMIGLAIVNPVYFFCMLLGSMINIAVGTSVILGTILGPVFYLFSPEWCILYGGVTAGIIAFFAGELND